MRGRKDALGLALGTVAAVTFFTGASAQDATIAFAGKDELTVSIKDGSGKATVIVVNGGAATTIDWTVELAPASDGSKRTALVEPVRSDIGERSPQIVPLVIKNVSSTGKLSGVLVGTPAGSGTPITRALTISNFGLALPLDPATIVGAALGLSFLLLVIRYFTLNRAVDKGPLSNPKWSFTTSWASTFTGAGALLATLVSAGALPASPYLLEKSEFAALGIFFGALALVAPVVFVALNNARAPVVIFHVATWLTTAAVLGQLTTVVLLLADAHGQGTSSWFVLALGTVEVAGVALILLYVFRQIPGALKDARATTATVDAVEPRGWALL